MRYLYSFLMFICICANAYSQNSSIQVELVDNTVGVSDGGCNSCGLSVSNDDGLNQIFASYNLFGYDYMEPDTYLGENGAGYFYKIYCSSNDVISLLTDLNAYSTVIRYAAEETVDGVSVNVLNLNLIDANTGMQTGTTTEGLVVTNDDGLNQIFEDFSVRKYIEYPEPDTNQYTLVCDCDAQLLKNELNNYSSVISFVSDVNYMMLLSVDEITKTNINIHPNPFKDKISIEINKPIESIEIYDILGKSINKSSSVSEVENYSSTLKSGVYLLKITTKDGNTMTKKLIKS